MIKLNGFIPLFVLAMMGATASAQMTIVIDNQQIPTSHIASITILPNANQINIVTTVDYDVSAVNVGSNVAITSFSVSPGSILSGSDATFRWATENAVSCDASNGVDGWAATSITVPGGKATLPISNLGNNQRFTLTCNGSKAGDEVTRDVFLTVNSPDAVSITSFVASPSTVIEGSNTTISWASQNTTTCKASGGTGDWNGLSVNPTGSTIVTASTAGNYTFTLTCKNDSGSTAIKTTSLLVEADVVQCDASPLSVGTNVDWGGFWGSDFPNPRSGSKVTTVSKYGYKAIKFNTGNVNDYGEISVTENTATAGVVLGVISQCPGDFSVSASCDYKWGLGGSLRWSTVNKAYSCELLPNTDYYFNFTYTNGKNVNDSTCSKLPCRVVLEHKNR